MNHLHCPPQAEWYEDQPACFHFENSVIYLALMLYHVVYIEAHIHLDGTLRLSLYKHLSRYHDHLELEEKGYQQEDKLHILQ
jgi:hypothetical protein